MSLLKQGESYNVTRRPTIPVDNPELSAVSSKRVRDNLSATLEGNEPATGGGGKISRLWHVT